MEWLLIVPTLIGSFIIIRLCVWLLERRDHKPHPRFRGCPSCSAGPGSGGSAR